MNEFEIECAECGAPMTLRNSKYGKFFGCTNFPECRGTHGTYPDGRPLGNPADAETKHYRIAAHYVFDSLWKSKMVTRNRAYSWMQQVMTLSSEEAHIGNFTKEQCKRLIMLVGKQLTRVCLEENNSVETDAGIEMYIIHKNLKEYPGRYVLKRWVIIKNDSFCDPEPTAIGNHVDEVVKHIPLGFVSIGNSYADDKIYNIWV
jgi:ssDNA-binding Zn-finger/Zn-ribbon topoisomerase 1